jgi:hypothetical protein
MPSSHRRCRHTQPISSCAEWLTVSDSGELHSLGDNLGKVKSDQQAQVDQLKANIKDLSEANDALTKRVDESEAL